jgi:hypothetical protein
VRTLNVIGTLLIFAPMVMAYFAHSGSSGLLPYFYVTVAVWLAFVVISLWFEARQRNAELRDRSH